MTAPFKNLQAGARLPLLVSLLAASCVVGCASTSRVADKSKHTRKIAKARSSKAVKAVAVSARPAVTTAEEPASTLISVDSETVATVPTAAPFALAMSPNHLGSMVFMMPSGQLEGPFTEPLKSELLPATTAALVETNKSPMGPRAEAAFNALAVPTTSAKTPFPKLGVAAADHTASKANNEARLIFDFPVTYNARVRKWIKYFQTTGRPSFRRWLERSSRYVPQIQEEMTRANLPTDLAYVAMIESGFSSSASSHANALGMWQFIAPTGQRYGLSIDWWIDERRDFEKSTKAAIGYMTDLFGQFGSWYLVAASYNMGENGVRRLIKRHGTNSFWALADRGALPEETRNYLPKMLAAMLIAKAPALYGFRELEFQAPYAYDTLDVPGGTDLINLANHLGVSERALTELNPELLKAFVPREVKTHRIRIPKGSKIAVSQYVNGSGRTIQ